MEKKKMTVLDFKKYKEEGRKFAYIDTPPKELLAQWAAEREPKPTLDNTAFYAVDEDGETYFYCGGSRLKVREHFADTGKPVAALIENVIDYTAQ